MAQGLRRPQEAAGLVGPECSTSPARPPAHTNPTNARRCRQPLLPGRGMLMIPAGGGKEALHLSGADRRNHDRSWQAHARAISRARDPVVPTPDREASPLWLALTHMWICACRGAWESLIRARPTARAGDQTLPSGRPPRVCGRGRIWPWLKLIVLNAKVQRPAVQRDGDPACDRAVAAKFSRPGMGRLSWMAKPLRADEATQRSCARLLPPNL